MMDIFAIVCGIISSGLAIYCGIPYFFSIIRGETKPHQFTWLIFTIMNGIVLVSQYLEGARASALISLVFFIYSLIDFLLALKYGVRNSSRYDRLLLVLALATIVAWIFTKDNAVALWLTVLIDVFATTMMVLKIRRHPGSEPFRLWLIATVAYMFAWLALINTSFGILHLRPIYGILSDFAIIAAILYFRPKIVARHSQSKFPEVE